MSVFAIAEIGSCHDGSWDKAVRLVQLAADCGFDACKFQFFSDPDKLAARRNAEAYRDVYRRYQIPEEWLAKLSRLCLTHGIEFMCSVYLEEDIKVIAPYVKRFKCSSFEAGDTAFLDAHKPFKKPVIVSTGMIQGDDAVIAIAQQDAVETLLHCTSAYPTPSDETNLRAIATLSRYCTGFYGYQQGRVGLSDHTRNVLTGALAVAAGAEVVEVHVRLDDTDEANPDYAVSLPPAQAHEYVQNIRTAEAMMGSGLKEPQPSEEPMMAYRVT